MISFFLDASNNFLSDRRPGDRHRHGNICYLAGFPRRQHHISYLPHGYYYHDAISPLAALMAIASIGQRQRTGARLLGADSPASMFAARLTRKMPSLRVSRPTIIISFFLPARRGINFSHDIDMPISFRPRKMPTLSSRHMRHMHAAELPLFQLADSSLLCGMTSADILPMRKTYDTGGAFRAAAAFIIGTAADFLDAGDAAKRFRHFEAPRPRRPRAQPPALRRHLSPGTAFLYFRLRCHAPPITRSLITEMIRLDNAEEKTIIAYHHLF